MEHSSGLDFSHEHPEILVTAGLPPHPEHRPSANTAPGPNGVLAEVKLEEGNEALLHGWGYQKLREEYELLSQTHNHLKI